MNQKYTKGDRLKITKQGTKHFDHTMTVDYQMDSYVAGVCSCEEYIYPYKDQIEKINNDPIVRIELSISQINELERQLASKLAEGVDTLSKMLSDVARILEPKVKK